MKTADQSNQLAPEDALRLSVLLAGEVHAVRLDERAPALHALTPRGEARIALHPDCRTEQYLMRVRGLLGGHALGSPGGYPVHLKRWTRMGQVGPNKLGALLLLGEAEAVAAVAHAPGLTDELARRAWWAQPTIENARSMLGNPEVARGAMAKPLADFLIEHLPFEEDPAAAMNTVRAVLAAGQPDADGLLALWARARTRPHYFIGFLEYLPDALPGDEPPLECGAAVSSLAATGNAWAIALARACSASGQSFLKAAAAVLEKPAVPDAVYALFDAIGAWCGALAAAPGRAALAHAAPGHAQAIEALSALSALDAAAAAPILGRSSAVGALMRRQLEPVAAPLLARLQALRQTAPTLSHD